MLKKKIIIPNKLGLHARAAAKLVNLAARYGSEIWLMHGQRKANGKSIMGVMMLAAAKGSSIELTVNGDDENEAMSALEALINNKFGESE